ncbi:MAG TPA: methyltransferase domain-containing protein [Bryobacteraceae bacterium]|jgi:tRNA (mo5U34)-methyltransferase|nr:methyltransferase domain-containing protein [Bryobacteraceae bacterium]
MQKARNQEYTADLQRLSGKLAELGYYHSIELPDGTVIPGIQSVEKQRWRLSQFPIPQDLRGKRVLDIGAWDGWFSFEMERRGASVVAVDATRRTRFLEAKAMLNSKVEHVVADISFLTPRDIGYFDIVLFFGVLYHLKHPMLALERVCELTTDLACIESLVTDDPPDGAIPVMEFYEGTQLAGQFDNWVGPNISCLMAMCRTAGFARVDFKSVSDFRAHVICNRKWAEVARTGAAPELIVVENSELLNHTFSAHRDDYVTVWIHRDEPDLTCDDICVQIGPYGARPAAVANVGAAWQANCKLPLGLAPGWYDVSVSVRSSEWSNRARIAVDLPSEAQICTPTTRDFEISIVCDGRTWERNQVRTGLGSCLSAWVGGLPDGLQRTEVSFRLNGTDLPCCYVSPVDDGKGKQVNAMVPAGLDRGAYKLSLRCRNEESQPVTIQLF